MSLKQCVHRDYTVTADVVEHPGIPTPWAAGVHITAPDGRTTRRISLPMKYAFLSELEKAQSASLAHGRWLVDQSLNEGHDLFASANS